MSSKRKIQREKERRERIKKLSHKCICGKTIAPDRLTALAMAQQQFKIHGGEMPKRVYECDKRPGVWHWTRMEKPPLSLPKNHQPEFYTEDYWKA